MESARQLYASSKEHFADAIVERLAPFEERGLPLRTDDAVRALLIPRAVDVPCRHSHWHGGLRFSSLESGSFRSPPNSLNTLLIEVHIILEASH